MIKTSTELASLREAARIADVAQLEAHGQVREGMHERDLYQVPDTATDFLRDQEALNGDRAVSPVNDDLTLLPRKLVLQLRANANVSLGSGYRAYPGFSVAQVRKQLGLGW